MLKGYNFKPLQRTLKEIFVPSVSQVILFLIIALVILCTLFFDYFTQFVVGDDPVSKYYFSEAIGNYIATANETPISEYIGSIMVWGLVGAAAYIGLLTVVDALITARNIVIEKRGDATHKKQDSFSLLDEYRRIIWIILSFVLVLLTIFTFLRPIFDMFQVGLEELHVIPLVLSPLLLALNLYVVYMFIWVAVRNPNVLARN